MNSLFIGILMCEHWMGMSCQHAKKESQMIHHPFLLLHICLQPHLIYHKYIYIYISCQDEHSYQQQSTIWLILHVPNVPLLESIHLQAPDFHEKTWTTTRTPGPCILLPDPAWNCARHEAGVFLVLSNDGLVQTCRIGCKPKTNAEKIAWKLVKWEDDYIYNHILYFFIINGTTIVPISMTLIISYYPCYVIVIMIMMMIGRRRHGCVNFLHYPSIPFDRCVSINN